MTRATVVIGYGADELVAAHLLARAGHRVVVLGEGRTTEATRGWIAPAIVRALGLDRHGLRMERDDPWAVAPLDGGVRLELWQDHERSAASIARISPRDAARWPAFCERMARLARFVESAYLEPPPDPVGVGADAIGHLARVAWRARRMGREGLTDLLRVLPMPVADLLDDWFESDALKGLLAAAAVAGLRRGPRAAGTAFSLLDRHVGNRPGVFRPPRSNAAQVLAALPGIEFRGDARAARIALDAGGVSAVALVDGTEIPAGRVISGLDPRRTLLELLEPGWLGAETVRTVRNIRARGVVAEVAIASAGHGLAAPLVLAPSLDYLERAADAAKYGKVSAEPLAVVRPTTASELEVELQYVPYALADGPWDDDRRGGLERLARDTLRRWLPELTGAVEVTAVRTPVDLETARGWPQGQAAHAELALDQALWMRPVPELARYRTPIDGLYLCGPAMHPGPGAPGAAGAHAARAILGETTFGARR
jgi:phytoene dehydrogenase-like protein